MRIEDKELPNYHLKQTPDDVKAYWLVGDTYGGKIVMNNDKVEKIILPERVEITSGTIVADNDITFTVKSIIESPLFKFILKHE